jgi:SAM-dependent methyltransferase
VQSITAKKPLMTMSLISNRWRKSLKKVPLAVPLVRLAKSFRAWLDPQQRGFNALKGDPDSRLLQPSAVTKADRYPALFAYVRQQLLNVQSPHILSYGCSSGEEVFSLRKYIPHGILKGIDINPASIKICQKKLSKMAMPNVEFDCLASPAMELSEKYDAIFCLAVLRHGALQGPRPDRCDAHIRFEDVAALVRDLARCVKPGGFLVLQNCHFRFGDMPMAAQFDVVFRDPEEQHSNELFYGPDNVRLEGPPYRDVIFQKRLA